MSRFESEAILRGHTRAVNSVAIIPNHRRIITASADGTLKIWDAALGCVLTLYGHEGEVCCVQVLPNGPLQAHGVNAETPPLKVKDLRAALGRRGLPTHGKKAELQARLASAPPDGGGGVAVSGSEDTTLKLWDLDTGSCLRTMEGHSVGVFRIILLPNGRLCSGGSEELKIWNPSTGTCHLTLQFGHLHLHGLACLPDDRFISSTFGDFEGFGEVQSWDLTGRCLQDLTHTQTTDGDQLADDAVNDIKVLPNGHIIFGTEGGTIQQWDLTEEVCVRRQEPGERIFRIGVLADGRIFSGHGTGPGLLKVWSGDLSGDACLQTLSDHTSAITDIAELPDGRVATTSWDYTIRIWCETPREIERQVAKEVACQRACDDVAKTISKFL